MFYLKNLLFIIITGLCSLEEELQNFKNNL